MKTIDTSLPIVLQFVLKENPLKRSDYIDKYLFSFIKYVFRLIPLRLFGAEGIIIFPYSPSSFSKFAPSNRHSNQQGAQHIGHRFGSLPAVPPSAQLRGLSKHNVSTEMAAYLHEARHSIREERGTITQGCLQTVCPSLFTVHCSHLSHYSIYISPISAFLPGCLYTYIHSEVIYSIQVDLMDMHTSCPGVVNVM